MITNTTADQLNAIIESTDTELFDDENYMTGIMGTIGYNTISLDEAYVFYKDGSFDTYITVMGRVDYDLSNALSKAVNIIRTGGYYPRRIANSFILALTCKNHHAPNYAIEDARESLDTYDFKHCFDGRSGGNLCLIQYAGQFGHMRYDCDGTDTVLEICNTIESLVDITSSKSLSTLTTTLTSITSQVENFKNATFEDDDDNDDYDPDTDPYEIEDDGTFGTEED